MRYEQKYLKYKQKYLYLKNQIGGNGTIDVTAFAEANGMTLEKFHEILHNVNYKKQDNNMGLHNPMIIGNYVVRSIGHRVVELQTRLREPSDTNDALIAMANVTDNVYIDKTNNDKYICINRVND